MRNSRQIICPEHQFIYWRGKSVRCDFTFVNPLWFFPIILSFICQWMTLICRFLHNLPGHCSEADQPLMPQILFLDLWTTMWHFPFSSHKGSLWITQVLKGDFSSASSPTSGYSCGLMKCCRTNLFTLLFINPFLPQAVPQSSRLSWKVRGHTLSVKGLSKQSFEHCRPLSQDVSSFPISILVEVLVVACQFQLQQCFKIPNSMSNQYF